MHRCTQAWPRASSSILTKIGGMGVSETLFEFFYPNTLSFAIAVASIALVLRRQYVLAGAALGLSVMVHPGLALWLSLP